MPERDYTVDLETARRYTLSVVVGFLDRGYFAEAFGYPCAREGRHNGHAGSDVEAYSRVVGGPNVWPPGAHAAEWDLPALLGAARFYFLHASAPTRYLDHTAYGCGRHPVEFDVESGQEEFRGKVNEVLVRLEPRMEMTVAGDVVSVVPIGMDQLLAVDAVGPASARYRVVISAAVAKFQAAASPADQKDAVRDLADLLEELRPEAARLFARPDESALFNIANNFAIRHRNARQRPDYDTSVWMPWIFFWYLAAVHAIVTALDREAGE